MVSRHDVFLIACIFMISAFAAVSTSLFAWIAADAGSLRRHTQQGVTIEVQRSDIDRLERKIDSVVIRFDKLIERKDVEEPNDAKPRTDSP